MSLLKRTGAIFVALFLLFGLMAPQTAHAEVPDETSITNAATWIKETWDADTKGTKFFAAGTVADGIIALSAANQYPDTVRSMLLNLKERGPGYTDFDGGYPAGLAKVIMTADMAGQNPRTFFGCERDLVADLKEMVDGGPVDSREYWGPYLIAIALTRANEEVPAWVIADMEKNQDTSGGFGYYEKDGSFVGDPDYTAVGISAMDRVANNPKNSADKARVAANVEKAKTWSADAKNQQQDSASNSYYWETYSSANSTGMLASSLSEVGVEVTSPVRYLKNQQKTDGGWPASHDGKNSDVMATTQAILGVTGAGYGTIRSTQVPELVDCDTTSPTTPPVVVPPKPVETVYNTPGDRVVNGREWRTSCEPFSQTQRCTTMIKAKTVKQVNGTFVAANQYVFNNLTYLPSPRSLWENNKLAAYGEVGGKVSWTEGGRQWRTECDTAVTGRGGCRSYITSSVIANVAQPGQPVRYGWVTQDIFNNVVQFS